MNPVQQESINFICTIANLLRGPYRPPQYRRVMLPVETAIIRLKEYCAALIAAAVTGKIDVRSALPGGISP